MRTSAMSSSVNSTKNRKNVTITLVADSCDTATPALDTLNHHQTYMGYGYLQNKEQLVPPIELVYWSFRLMVGFGSFLFALLIVLGWILLQTFGCCQLHRLFACHCYTALVTCAHYYQCGNNACDACHLNRA